MKRRTIKELDEEVVSLKRIVEELTTKVKELDNSLNKKVGDVTLTKRNNIIQDIVYSDSTRSREKKCFKCNGHFKNYNDL